MKPEDKKKSVDYWNRNAENWELFAFNPTGDFVQFPTSGQRGKVVVDEILRQDKGKDVSILDLGCANGDLVMSLIGNGYCNINGIDNSVAMIDEARKRLRQKSTSLDEEKIFVLGDADHVNLPGKYDFICAMGLIEYLTDINGFFLTLFDMLNESGLVFMESRNKLFNLFSANQYTLKSDISHLLVELEKSRCYSPIVDDAEIASLVGDIYSGVDIEVTPCPDSSYSPAETYPFDLPQYSPYELNSMLSEGGLKIRHVIYYHAHPFPPIFEKKVGPAFNKLALAMQPLGHTPIAATMFSSFIAVVEKR